MDTGVYWIKNKLNGKRYIGSAAKSLRNRLSQHLKDLRSDRHCNHYLQNAWNKYGEDAFEFKALERCLPERCIQREQYWIDAFKRSGLYNIYLVAGSPLGSKHSDESKKRMSEVAKKIQDHPSRFKVGHHVSVEVRKAVAEASRGRRHATDTVEKRADSMRWFYKSEEGKKLRATFADRNRSVWIGRKHSEESKRRMSESASRRPRREMSIETKRRIAESVRRAHARRKAAINAGTT